MNFILVEKKLLPKSFLGIINILGKFDIFVKLIFSSKLIFLSKSYFWQFHQQFLITSSTIDSYINFWLKYQLSVPVNCNFARGRRCISTLPALQPGYFGVLAMISDDSSCYSTWKSMSVGHGVIWTQTSIGDSLSYFTESGYQESDLKDKVANPKCRKQNLQSVHFPTVFIYWSKVDSKGTLLIVASSKASRLSDLTCNFQANTMKLEWYM